MADAEKSEKDATYWRAIQECVCSVCLDRSDDGSCGLPKARVCALARHLPLIAGLVHAVDSPRMDDYVDAVERGICSRCSDQDESSRCRYRDNAMCALYAYLPLVLDAITSADEQAPAPR